GSGPRTFALLTDFITANLDLGFFAKGCLFKGQVQIDLLIAAALNIPALPAPAAHVHTEEIAEDVAKNVAEVSHIGGIKSASVTSHAGMAKAVIAGALLRIHQDAVSFAGFFEFLFCFRVPRIAVRVILHGQLAVRALDILLRRGPFYGEYLVIIAFCLGSQN